VFISEQVASIPFVGFLPVAFALIVAGLNFAVAALCWGWPRGELWPLETRWAGAAMVIAGITTVAAALLVEGIFPRAALYVFTAGAILSFVAGTCGVTPTDAPHARRRRVTLVAIAIPLVVLVLVTQEALVSTQRTVGSPHVILTLPSAVTFAVVCGSVQLLEAASIALHWPRSQARSSLVAGSLVFLAGIFDVAALLGMRAPLIGAVTAGAIASSYIASRMLLQFRVALEGAEGRVPGYALRKFLGAGGMAEVFVAEAVGLLGEKRVAAVKRVRRDLVENQELCAMFLGEARLAAELRHPNIVEVYGFGTGGEGSAVRPYIAMELVDGMPFGLLLRYATAKKQEVPLGVVTEIGLALCSALEYAHTLTSSEGEPLRVVHRDVSPANVLIARDGRVKLIDFGIARAATREPHTRAGHMRGKIGYAAPEQIAGGPIDARTDIFALGVLLYEAAALKRPFAGSSEPAVVASILEGKRVPLVELRPEARELASVIERALCVDPRERWASARELGNALEKAAKGVTRGPNAVAEWFESVAGGPGQSEESTGPVIEVAASTTEASVSQPSGDTVTTMDPAPSSVARE
jgi:serine/threonine protein kinase